jgi:hypothetical protein
VAITDAFRRFFRFSFTVDERLFPSPCRQGLISCRSFTIKYEYVYGRKDALSAEKYQSVHVVTSPAQDVRVSLVLFRSMITDINYQKVVSSRDWGSYK